MWRERPLATVSEISCMWMSVFVVYVFDWENARTEVCAGQLTHILSEGGSVATPLVVVVLTFET